MGRAAPDLYDLAGKILAAEAGGRLEGVELGDAAERACKKLRPYFAQLIGSYGTQLLIERALSQTVEGFPFLKDVEVELDGRLEGLREKVGMLSQGEAREGLTMMLANFIGLLNDFIGKDLALHLLKRAWPELLPGEPGSRQEGEIS